MIVRPSSAPERGATIREEAEPGAALHASIRRTASVMVTRTAFEAVPKNHPRNWAPHLAHLRAGVS
jgi:hypothetical protein